MRTARRPGARRVTRSAADDTGGDADGHASRGDVGEHDRIGTDDASCADGDTTEHLASDAEDDAVTDRGDGLGLVPATDVLPAQRHLVVDRDALTDDHVLVEDHALAAVLEAQAGRE